MKTLLFNPFQKYSDSQLLISGLCFSIIGIVLGFAFNARFDGFIDVHFAEKTTFTQPLFDTLINVFFGTAVFFIMGKSINKKTRFIDIFTTCLIAKTPLYLIAFLNTNDFMYNVTSRMVTMINPEKIDSIPTMDLTIVMASALIMIPMLVWSIALLFNGFKTATNAKETKHILLFILGIIITEVITKILIKQL